MSYYYKEVLMQIAYKSLVYIAAWLSIEVSSENNENILTIDIIDRSAVHIFLIYSLVGVLAC